MCRYKIFSKLFTDIYNFSILSSSTSAGYWLINAWIYFWTWFYFSLNVLRQCHVGLETYYSGCYWLCFLYWCLGNWVYENFNSMCLYLVLSLVGVYFIHWFLLSSLLLKRMWWLWVILVGNSGILSVITGSHSGTMCF